MEQMAMAHNSKAEFLAMYLYIDLAIHQETKQTQIPDPRAYILMGGTKLIKLYSDKCCRKSMQGVGEGMCVEV